MAANIENLTNSNFKATVESATTPVLVDFWAPWCRPCIMMAPVLEELAAELAGKLKICKVDVEANQEIGAEYRIMSLPTMSVFVNGQVVDQIIGLTSKADLKNRLAKYLA